MEDAATISSLPGEILAQIFKSGTVLSSGCIASLIKYSAVSQRWRSAALDYPDLWTTINVSFAARNVVALVKTSLERSKSCLFDITLPVPPSADMAIVTSVMLLVVQHVHRLRRLAITGRLASPTPFAFPNREEIFALLQNAQRAPRLAVLELSFSDPQPYVSMGISPGQLLLQAPSLISFRIHGVTSPVPFVGLRSLDIQGLRTSYADFRDMVVASPLLTELVLPKLRLMLDPQSKSLAPIEIPSLKTLALSFCKPHPSNQFAPCHALLPLLSLPNVEYLELAGSEIPDLATSCQPPSAFAKLRTLRLVNVSMVRKDEADNCAYLRALTTVESLELIHSHAEYLVPTGSKPNSKLRLPKARHRTRSISREVRSRSLLRPVEQVHFDPGLALPHEAPPSGPIYPNLRAVSLDTLIAAEALWLYQLVQERPDIRLVRLSAVAERHLATSLRTVNDVLQESPSRLLENRIDATDVHPVDVAKLLRERVAVAHIDDGYIQWQGAVI
ncbi:hypothetical protein DFH08DRAFT_224436 [Mycena albidolilacea]|uniref:F-box domain-containing protein n=1 Tax=Mycena albidolilacea TaxID=1033008 RepID=A0AAD6ZX61_9AGAR|nr:hypothetical protein DFH08DRAFT_224436 [Mycena albidolilacea]